MIEDSKQKNPTEPHDDRWHYLDFPEKKHSRNYFEWKYFNFTQEDLSGYIMYYIIDPERKTTIGGGRLLVRVLKDGKIYGTIKKISMDRISLDSISAGIKMDGAEVVEHDPFHYKLHCNLPDIAWDLTYKQDIPSIESFQGLNTGLFKWEKNNWLIKMPKAEVLGNIRIGEENFKIKSLGYSDTNWGKIIPLFSKYYEWGQYNDESFSLVFGIIYGLRKIKYTFFYFAIGKHIISMENAECTVKHTEWKKDENGKFKIPSKSSFMVENEEYEINFNTILLHSDSPVMKVKPFLPKIVVSEQIVKYEGTVKRNNKIIHQFKGTGFEEWSSKTWKKVSVVF